MFIPISTAGRNLFKDIYDFSVTSFLRNDNLFSLLGTGFGTVRKKRIENEVILILLLTNKKKEFLIKTPE